MAIKFRIRPQTLAAKIALVYIALFLFLIITVGFVFHYLVNDYLVRNAQDTLLFEGRAMADMVAGTVPGDPLQPRRLPSDRRGFMAVTRLVEGDYMIVGPDLRIIDSSREEDFPPGSVLGGVIGEKIQAEGLSEDGELRLKTPDYIVVATPITARHSSTVEGSVVLLTGTEELGYISQRIATLMVGTFIVFGLLAVVVAIGLGRSITKPLRQLEERIRVVPQAESEDRLELKTGDEVEQLNKSFNQMMDRLNDYHQAQQRLVQNVSHELKTPLMSIQGNAEALKEGLIKPQEKEQSLVVIIRQSQLLKKMVEDIIYFSKLENYEEAYRFEPIELEELLYEAVETFRSSLGEQNISLEFNPPGSVTVKADGEKLLRVFLNILSNAVRHARNKIVINMHFLTREVHIEIRDDGPGFPEADVERVFDRFYKQSREGTGLGLSIAQTIIHKHGGRIVAKNAPEGAVVQVILPLQEDGKTLGVDETK